MGERIDAVFENGVFRPEVPLSIGEGQRVLLQFEISSPPLHDLSDVQDLLDSEFVIACGATQERTPSPAEARQLLSSVAFSLADRISEERDER